MRLLLSRGAAINTLTNDGCTALIGACDPGILAAARVLLDAGADLTLRDHAGWSALDYAEDRVERDDEEPDEDEEAPTAAQRREHKALVRLLKKRGAA